MFEPRHHNVTVTEKNWRNFFEKEYYCPKRIIFLDLFKFYNGNALSEKPADQVDAALLGDAAEQQLYGVLQEVTQQVEPLLDGGDYGAALEQMASLREPIDRFFDEIMVMAQGRIIEAGSHVELLAKKGAYADLYNTQFKMHENTSS